MFSRETPFVGGKSLLFSWGKLNKICDKYGFETFGDFDEKFIRSNLTSFTFKEIVELLQLGLERTDQKGITKTPTTSEVNTLIEKYMDEGHAVNDIVLLIITSIYSALIKPRNQPGEVQGEIVPPTQMIVHEPSQI